MSNMNKEVIILNGISIILVIVVAFLAGMEGILDEFQFHQPLVACILIGLVTGQLVPCIILGGTLQMIALGWANTLSYTHLDVYKRQVLKTGRFPNTGLSAPYPPPPAPATGCR